MKQSKNQDGTLSQTQLFAEGSPDHANPLVMQAKGRGQKMTVISGLKCLELSKNLNHPTSLAKTLLVSLAWKMAKHLKGYSLTWKMKGIRRKHLLFQLVPSGRGTGEIESGLLPTMAPGTHGAGMSPSKQKCEDMSRGKTPKHQVLLVDKIIVEEYQRGNWKPPEHWKMFPTPTAADTFTGNLKSSQQKEGVNHSINLNQAIHMKMFPTPQARDYRSPDKPESGNYKRKIEKGWTIDLPSQIGGQLNPNWVEWLMGYPPGYTNLTSQELKQE